MTFGCIAEHLGHSFSASIHEKIDNYDYVLKEVSKDELDAFMKARDFRGINVTIPYKQDVIPYLDEIDERARTIGAVNTIVNRDGRLCGYNTDFGGMTALIRRMKLDLSGKKVLILGTGGTSKTANAVARALGASEALTVSRSKKENCLTYEEAARLHRDAQVLINTTPCGMYPQIDDMPVDLDSFPRLVGVVDAVFNPLSTKLVLSARKRGICAEGGLFMLVAQAVLAAEIFTGKTYASDTTERVYRELLSEKRNLVLIGMPASGKTTVGQAAAQRLGREFFDVDAYITQKAGTDIPTIFAEKGEAYFRDLETESVRELSARTGIVFATGGGTILRQENVDLLRMNGKLLFLDRPLERLLPTSDRPLGNTAQKIRQLYETRLPLYRAAADETVRSAETVEETAKRVIECFCKE